MPDPGTEAGRLRAYLAERFPLASYTVLVALFAGAGSLAAVRLGGGMSRPEVALVVLLAFFHLRVFDEHKDHLRDAVTHPERLLSRGVVTLADLRRWGAVAIVVEAAVSAWIGLPALLAWIAMFAFTVAMRFEFGMGERLNRSLLLYAVTHNPVVALLALLIHASTDAAWDARYLFFVAAASLGSLAFEIARKTRLPDEEVPGVDSYSSVYGRRVAGALVSGLVSAAAICGVFLTSRLSDSGVPLVPLLGGLVASRLLCRDRCRAKSVERGASLALLGLFAGVGLAAW
jgi:4-hydroxybenzoate polyprenyltransferase